MGEIDASSPARGCYSAAVVLHDRCYECGTHTVALYDRGLVVSIAAPAATAGVPSQRSRNQHEGCPVVLRVCPRSPRLNKSWYIGFPANYSSACVQCLDWPAVPSFGRSIY